MDFLSLTLVGDAKNVTDGLRSLVNGLGINEFMLSVGTYDPFMRIRALELLAER